MRGSARRSGGSESSISCITPPPRSTRRASPARRCRMACTVSNLISVDFDAQRRVTTTTPVTEAPAMPATPTCENKTEKYRTQYNWYYNKATAHAQTPPSARARHPRTSLLCSHMRHIPAPSSEARHTGARTSRCMYAAAAARAVLARLSMVMLHTDDDDGGYDSLASSDDPGPATCACTVVRNGGSSPLSGSSKQTDLMRSAVARGHHRDIAAPQRASARPESRLSRLLPQLLSHHTPRSRSATASPPMPLAAFSPLAGLYRFFVRRGATVVAWRLVW